MSETSSLTVDLPRELLDGLESLAASTGRDLSDLAGEALADYLRLRQSQIAGIIASLAEIDAGAKLILNDEVMAWMESWETANELPPPS